MFGVSTDDYYSDITVKQLLFSGGKYVSQLRSSKVSVEAQKQRLREHIVELQRANLELDRLAGPDALGLSKVSVQTGTSHGGIPLPGGGVAQVAIDFDTLGRLSAVCHGYGLAGCVQHGASTLPDELFHRFPAVEAAEIHLATGFQNLLYEHPAFPAGLRREIEGWCFGNAADERKDGETETQFLYKTRKKALGPYKRALWDLPTREEILADQEAKFVFLFEQLAVNGTAELVGRHVRPLEQRRPAPGAVRAAAEAVRAGS